VERQPRLPGIGDFSDDGARRYYLTRRWEP
jgi:hypothetical protein